MVANGFGQSCLRDNKLKIHDFSSEEANLKNQMLKNDIIGCVKW